MEGAQGWLLAYSLKRAQATWTNKEAQSAYSCLHRLGTVVFPLGSTKSLCSTREPKLLSLLSPPVVGPDCPNYDADYQQQHHHHFKYNDHHKPQATSHHKPQATSKPQAPNQRHNDNHNHINIPTPLAGSLVSSKPQPCTVGALIIRIGFWGPFYCNYNQEPQNSVGIS